MTSAQNFMAAGCTVVWLYGINQADQQAAVLLRRLTCCSQPPIAPVAVVLSMEQALQSQHMMEKGGQLCCVALVPAGHWYAATSTTHRTYTV